MEVSPSKTCSKKQKVSGESNTDSVRTEMSDLPDPILVYILSFLPTREALRASILSKRWKYLWMSVHSLCFHDGTDDNSRARKLFLDTVERVLLLRDSSNIQSFKLSCAVRLDTPRINTWICAALKHKVQVLKLQFHSTMWFTLPHSLFSCESLTMLRIGMFEDLRVPACICLPHLKILILKHVTFLDGQSMHRLFCGCPVLEELTLNECAWDNVNAVCISIPTLQSLLIYESTEDGNNCQVMIFGKSLKSFDYGGDLKNDYCLCNLSSLVDSSVVVGKISDIEEDGRQREVAYRAHKLLRGLSNVRDLYLSYETVQVLNYTAELFTHLPVYYNLTLLRVHLGSVNFACRVLQNLLQNTPSLTTLEFLEGIFLGTSCNTDEWKLDPVPPSFTTKLKTIEIGHFAGTQAELDAVRILLQAATVLERICIKLGDSMEDEEFYRVMCLYTLKGSTSCEMCFHV